MSRLIFVLLHVGSNLAAFDVCLLVFATLQLFAFGSYFNVRIELLSLLLGNRLVVCLRMPRPVLIRVVARLF
jgi:hypothetical protein